MTNASFLERINIILEAIKNNPISVYVIPGIILLSTIMMIFSNRNKKVGKVLTIVLTILLIGTAIYFFSNPIMSFIDYLVEVIVNNILFPNLALYITTILIIDLTLIYSILSNKMSKLTRLLNIFTFSIMQILLFFIVSNVLKNNIDVYEVLTIYTNQELLVLIEANMIIFAIWIVLLLIMRITKNLTENKIITSEQKEVSNDIVIDYNDIDSDELMEYVPIKKKRV